MPTTTLVGDHPGTPGPWLRHKGAYGALWIGPAQLPHPGREAEDRANRSGRSLLAEREADARLLSAALPLRDVLALLLGYGVTAEARGEDIPAGLRPALEAARAVLSSLEGDAP